MSYSSADRLERLERSWDRGVSAHVRSAFVRGSVGRSRAREIQLRSTVSTLHTDPIPTGMRIDGPCASALTV